MAGVLSIPRRPFDDLRSESNENKKKQRSDGLEKSEMVKLTMDLFGDSISLDDLRKVGESARAARIAIHLLAGCNHDFDDVEFQAKLYRFMDLLRGRDDAPFEASAFIIDAIKALHEEHDFGKLTTFTTTFTTAQDLQLYMNFNKLGADKMRNVRNIDVKKCIIIEGQSPAAVAYRVQTLRASLNKLGERRNHGAIGDEAFKPRYGKKDRKVRLTCIRNNIYASRFSSSARSLPQPRRTRLKQTTMSFT
jgi:hypothetical protein